jgi:hypothetical protein
VDAEHRRLAKKQLEKRFVEELELRNTPVNTCLTYRRCIERFERHFGKSAAQLGRVGQRQPRRLHHASPKALSRCRARRTTGQATGH